MSTTYVVSTFLNGLNIKAKITLLVVLCESVYETFTCKYCLGPLLITLTTKIIKSQNNIKKKTHYRFLIKKTTFIGNYSSAIYVLCIVSGVMWCGIVFTKTSTKKLLQITHAVFFYVFSTLHHSIELFHLPTLMHNSLFINNMYITLLSWTCFEH